MIASHLTNILPRLDIDGNGQPSFCFFGNSKVALMQVSGNSLREVSLPYYGGARSVAWADYNGDGKPDLVLATAAVKSL